MRKDAEERLREARKTQVEMVLEAQLLQRSVKNRASQWRSAADDMQSRSTLTSCPRTRNGTPCSSVSSAIFTSEQASTAYRKVGNYVAVPRLSGDVHDESKLMISALVSPVNARSHLGDLDDWIVIDG